MIRMTHLIESVQFPMMPLSEVSSNIEDVQAVVDNFENKDASEVFTIIKDWVSQVSETAVSWFVNFAIGIIIAIIIYIIGRKLITVLLNMLSRSMEKTNVNVGVSHFFSSFAKILLYIILFLMIGRRFGLEVSSVIALLGSAGVAVALALKDSLSNLAAGILILVLKPFNVGDYIIPSFDSDSAGTVASIDFFYTKILTIDNMKIAVPNGLLVSNSVTNATAQEKRRLEIKVGISYHNDIKLAKDVMLNVMMHDEACLTEEEIIAFVDELGDHAVVIGSRIWVKAENYIPAKWRITEEIKEQFDQNGVEIPYQQLDVWIKETKESL